ncbi:SAM-dependent methyltransferase [Luteolibacter algae]|uniref:SAM-dependent methyltransferase n=1 Tax=Luteolibacter algae TaxID=454151 RepID=A0ABW5D4P7_9BACT
MKSTDLLTTGKVPDSLIRLGIRHRLANTISPFEQLDPEERQLKLIAHMEGLKNMPIAISTDAANEQHYELPTRFFQRCLGPHMKYSSGYWEEGVIDLAEAESRMLEITSQRADLRNGQKILELGCGWGSLTLWMAKHYPDSRITAVSNSRTQREHILEQAERRNLYNIEVITANMIDFEGLGESVFDRVVSVEMFEHMKNYQLLLQRISSWLRPEGKLFVHIFTHRENAYHYTAENDDDWMAKYFFTGGQMPSDDLLLYFQDHLRIEQHWQVSGQHYQKTSEAWLRNMDDHKDELFPLISETYGPENAIRWWTYWRVFFMACAELWGYRRGNEWIVSHYLFSNRKA